MLNYVIQEYTGISGCFTSPLLYGTTLNIVEGRQSVSYIQTLNNIGEVNNPRKWRSCRKAEGVDLPERAKLNGGNIRSQEKIAVQQDRRIPSKLSAILFYKCIALFVLKRYEMQRYTCKGGVNKCSYEEWCIW